MLNYCSSVNVLLSIFKEEVRANMTRAISRVHTGWQQQSLVYWR